MSLSVLAKIKIISIISYKSELMANLVTEDVDSECLEIFQTKLLYIRKQLSYVK